MRQYTTIDRYDRTQGILIISYWLKKTHHNRSNVLVYLSVLFTLFNLIQFNFLFTYFDSRRLFRVKFVSNWSFGTYFYH